jgi:hypothetical protein
MITSLNADRPVGEVGPIHQLLQQLSRNSKSGHRIARIDRDAQAVRARLKWLTVE